MPLDAFLASFLGVAFEMLNILLRWVMGEVTYGLLTAVLP